MIKAGYATAYTLIAIFHLMVTIIQFKEPPTKKCHYKILASLLVNPYLVFCSAIISSNHSDCTAAETRQIAKSKINALKKHLITKICMLISPRPDAAAILFRRRYLPGQNIVGTHDNFLNTSLTANSTVAISALGIITKEELVGYHKRGTRGKKSNS